MTNRTMIILVNDDTPDDYFEKLLGPEYAAGRIGGFYEPTPDKPSPEETCPATGDYCQSGCGADKCAVGETPKQWVEANMWLTADIPLAHPPRIDVLVGRGTPDEILASFPESVFQNARAAAHTRELISEAIQSLESRFTLGYSALPVRPSGDQGLVENAFRWRVDFGLIDQFRIDAVGPNPDNVVVVPDGTTRTNTHPVVGIDQ